VLVLFLVSCRIAPALKNPPTQLLVFCSLLLVVARPCQAYSLEGPSWPWGANVVIRLGLGPAAVPLQDGFGSWNASAADALAIWNGYLDFIHVSSVASATVPQRSGDGVNAVFFSATIFGDSFGTDTLAVTVLQQFGPGSPREADVVVNSAYRYSSYPGPLHRPIYDFHRIMLHEFGHVLRLDHDASAPLGTKLMEPIISDWDHLGLDDTAGIRRLYSAHSYFFRPAQTTRVGFLFDDFLITEDSPTATFYSAIGLPPGISVNSTTGQVAGNATKGGVYNGVITGHYPFGNVYAPLQLEVLGLEEIPGLVKIIPFLDAVSLLADPIRPRIYVAGAQGISMIDTRTFAVTSLLRASLSDVFLSISADFSTLLFTQGTGPHVRESRIDLQSLSQLPPRPLPSSYSAVLEGLNNQAYVAAAEAVYQIDATTGAFQQSFAAALSPPNSPPTIAMSKDRKTLYVARSTQNGDLSSFDISTPNPQLLHQFSGNFSGLVPDRNGLYLYYLTSSGGASSLKQARLPALSPVRVVSSSTYLASTAVAPNGSIYQTLPPSFNAGSSRSASYSVYDPASLHQTGHVETDDFLPEPLRGVGSYTFGDTEVDSSGKYFFAIVNSYFANEIWVLSTDLASFPAAVHPTKNLLNISTRGRVAAGEETMIGGFIIQGTKPKKVTIRGLGPSLPITGAMSNPVLDLYDSAGTRLVSNDDWTSNRINTLGTLLAPSSPRESALTVRLSPGAYTTLVRDVHNQPGLALVEIYDTDPKNSRLANISTRGKVGTEDNVLIGGFIVGGANPTRVIVRAIGPSLSINGVRFPLADPTLELHDATGKLIARNDDWRVTQSSQIIATGLPPRDNRESAILTTLRPGNYTAIVRGKNGATGVALVELYNLDAASTVN
jgi:hypothetical protein